MKIKKPKIIVILGQTATGKSDLAVSLAKKYNGEVISADSRQIYKGLDIGTGKITKKEMRDIPHHMIDVISPNKNFSVYNWKANTEKIIKKIISRNKLPIICGGTGFYIEGIVDGKVLPEVPKNTKLRKELSKKTAEELLINLKKLDKERAKSIDPKNKVRIIRAIEIAQALGSVPKIKRIKNPYEILEIGLNLPKEELQKKIKERLVKRIQKGMIEEGKTLYKKGLTFKRMRELGLEYRYLADYLQNKISKDELVKKLDSEIWHFAKRQMTWFKRDKRIKWFQPKETKKIEKEIESFLRK